MLSKPKIISNLTNTIQKSIHIQYVIKKIIYLLCSKNCLGTCLRGFSWYLIFTYSLLKVPGKCFVLSVDFITSFVDIVDGKHLFLSAINQIFIIIKLSLYREVLIKKHSEIFLFWCIVKNVALLGVYFCSIKLHAFRELDQKFLLAK